MMLVNNMLLLRVLMDIHV